MNKRQNSVFNDNIDTHTHTQTTVNYNNINDTDSSLMNKRQNSIKLI